MDLLAVGEAPPETGNASTASAEAADRGDRKARAVGDRPSVGEPGSPGSHGKRTSMSVKEKLDTQLAVVQELLQSGVRGLGAHGVPSSWAEPLHPQVQVTPE